MSQKSPATPGKKEKIDWLNIRLDQELESYPRMSRNDLSRELLHFEAFETDDPAYLQ